MTDRDSKHAIMPLHLDALPDRPLVSVLIANYNYSNYLGEAIESVLKQTYQHFELIVCDDGSTDDSCSIIEEYKRRDPRIMLVRKQNGGQASALNAAYRESKGKIVCLLDADDIYLPEKLQLVVTAFSTNPMVGFVAHRVIRVDRMGRQRGVLPLVAHSSIEWNAPSLLGNGGILPDLPPCSALCQRREVAELIFPLAEEKVHADAIIQRLAPLITPVMRLDQPLSEYRLHGSNGNPPSRVTVGYLERELEVWLALWEIQRNYLASVDSKLSENFASLEASLSNWLMRYMHARLKENESVRFAYQRVVSHPDFRLQPRMMWWFWQSSIFLPRPIFSAAINFLIGENIIKQFIGQVRSRGRVTGRAYR